MSFVNFDFDSGRAQVWQENVEENGWVFDYDETNKVFRVWTSTEHQAGGLKEEAICRSLNEVFELVKGFS